jgi:parvulin-like peptidyl-prolyl isomerase
LFRKQLLADVEGQDEPRHTAAMPALRKVVVGVGERYALRIARPLGGQERTLTLRSQTAPEASRSALLDGLQPAVPIETLGPVFAVAGTAVPTNDNVSQRDLVEKESRQLNASVAMIRTKLRGSMFPVTFLLIVICLFFSQSARSQADAVLAEIGQFKITVSDLDNKVNRILKIQEHVGEPVDPDKEAILLEMVRIAVFSKEALAVGLEKDKEVIDRMNNLRKRNKVDTEDHLQENDEDKARARVINEYVLATAYLEKEFDDKIEISDTEALGFFQRNRSDFMDLEKIKARQIFIMTSIETDMGEARKEAEGILERLNNGEDFIALAREFSDDSLLKETGGDLGYFTRGRLVPELEETVFQLSRGEVTPILQTSDGFHIFKLEDRVEGKPREYQDVRGEIVKKLKDERRDELYNTIEEELFKKYEVKVFRDLIPISPGD